MSAHSWIKNERFGQLGEHCPYCHSSRALDGTVTTGWIAPCEPLPLLPIRHVEIDGVIIKGPRS
jgi:hypothetical protein